MYKEELIIIRHARSKHNTKETEELDASLNDFGLKQAQNLGLFFSHMNPQDYEWFCSPFLRCLQTMKPMAELCNVKPMVMFQLREYLNHSRRGVFVANRKEQFPQFCWDLYPDAGEEYDEEFNEVFLHRMQDAFHVLPQKSIVVTHGLPALALLKVASDPTNHGIPVWDHSIDNASISIIRKGRVIWHGRNLYHEVEYDAKSYRRDWDGVIKAAG